MKYKTKSEQGKRKKGLRKMEKGNMYEKKEKLKIKTSSERRNQKKIVERERKQKDFLVFNVIKTINFKLNLVKK